MFFVQEHMKREKKIYHFGPPNYLEDMIIMYEKSRVSDLSVCILGQKGTSDCTPIGRQKDDQNEEHEEEEVTPSSFTGKILKRKGKCPKKSPFKKENNPPNMRQFINDHILINYLKKINYITLL
jgi:hypothetical protein